MEENKAELLVTPKAPEVRESDDSTDKDSAQKVGAK